MPASVAVPSLVSAGSSILGGIFGSSASNKAAQQQAAQIDAAKQQVSQAVSGAQEGEGKAVGIANDQIKEGVTGANATLGDVYSQQKQNLQPYLQAGEQGVNSLAAAYAPGGDLTKQFSFTGQDLQNEPGYQFGLQQGTDALRRNAAASGGAYGGGTMAALNKFGQDYAGTKFNDAYGRALNTFQTNHTNTMQGLLSLAGIGQTGTSQFNQAAQNYGNTTAGNLMAGGQLLSGNTLRASEYGGNAGIQGAQTIADLLGQKGNAQASGTIGSANAWSGALGGIGNGVQNAYGMKTLQSLYKPAGAGSGGGGGGGFNYGSFLPPGMSYNMQPDAGGGDGGDI